MPGIFSRRLPRPAAALLRVAVPVAIALLLWRIVDPGDVAALLSRAQPGLVAAALALVLVQNLASAFRWRLTAERLGLGMSRRRAASEYFLSQLLNMTLPAGMIGDAARAVRSRGGGGLLPAGQAVVIDRLTGQVALFATMGAGLGLTALRGHVEWPGWVGGIALGAAALGAGLGAALWLGRRSWGPVRRFSDGTATAMRRAVLSSEVWPRQAAFSLLIVACNLGAFALCAAATGTVLSPLAVISLVPLILVTMVIPVSIGGWGVREGAAAALWPVIGASAEAGIAASVTFGLVTLAASLPGVAGLVGRNRRAAVGPGPGT